jgi:uncharacterized membrane protein YqjE
VSVDGSSAEKSIGEAMSDVSAKASLLIREEIELAKAEVTEKVTSLVKGGAVAIAAGVFAVFALIYLLSALAWFFNDLFDVVNTSPWVGFLLVFGILAVFTAIAAGLGVSWIKRGSPPAPTMAIEEAKITRAELTEGRQ